MAQSDTTASRWYSANVLIQRIGLPIPAFSPPIVAGALAADGRYPQWRYSGQRLAAGIGGAVKEPFADQFAPRHACGRAVPVRLQVPRTNE